MSKKSLVAMIAVIALVASIGSPASAGAADDGPTAASSAKLVRIFGPARIKAKRKLRFPVYCSQACQVTVRYTIAIPGSTLRGVINGKILANTKRFVVLTLNGPATSALKSNVSASRLRIRVAATNLDNGNRGFARRTLRFKR